MTNKTDTKSGPVKMQPVPDAPDGVEVDNHGNIIPLSKRTEEDRQAALKEMHDKKGA